MGHRTLRSRIRYPRRRSARTAASSPIAPSCLRVTTPTVVLRFRQSCPSPIESFLLHTRLCGRRFQTRPLSAIRRQLTRFGQGPVEEPRSDWRRAVAAVSERRVAEGRALYTERSPAELYRGARSSERERYARQASRLGAERPSTRPPPSAVTSIWIYPTSRSRLRAA